MRGWGFGCLICAEGGWEALKDMQMEESYQVLSGVGSLLIERYCLLLPPIEGQSWWCRTPKAVLTWCRDSQEIKIFHFCPSGSFSSFCLGYVLRPTRPSLLLKSPSMHSSFSFFWQFPVQLVLQLFMFWWWKHQLGSSSSNRESSILPINIRVSFLIRRRWFHFWQYECGLGVFSHVFTSSWLFVFIHF